jgi:hypothetical protein
LSLHRYAKQRDANEAEIVAALEAVGATVERLDTPVDLLVGYRGRNFLLEVKAPLGPRGGRSAGRYTDDQAEWHRSWRGQRAVVRSVDDALRAIGAKRGERAA